MRIRQVENPPKTRVCVICQIEKPLEDFAWKVKAKDQRQSGCKRCMAAYARTYRADNPVKVKAVNERYYSAERLAILAQKRDYYLANREEIRQKTANHYLSVRDDPAFKLKSRERGLRQHFGLSLADFDALAEKQGGVCAICGQKPSGKLPLTVDHDHLTGRIRGLLCRPCNSFLGRIGDSSAKLDLLRLYLDG